MYIKLNENLTNCLLYTVVINLYGNNAEGFHIFLCDTKRILKSKIDLKSTCLAYYAHNK